MNDVVIEDGFKYLESKGGPENLLLLHGLFGATGNYKELQRAFWNSYNVITPILPIMTLPIKKLGLSGLVEHIHAFVKHKGYEKLHLVGNSLGGHLAQLYALKYPEKVSSMTLTGSSGLFENAMGSTFPKRGNYEFIKEKAQSIFYDPKTATKEIIDEVFDTVNDRTKAIRIVVTAKSAIRNNLEDKIRNIKIPTLLVWGKDDTITPLWVGQKFHDLLPNSDLEIFDKCGHAPMMEQPERFNTVLKHFLDRVIQKVLQL